MTAQHKYSFGNFTFDPTRKLLYLNSKDDEPCLLTEKEAAVLCYLLERPHQVVTREELIDSVWKDSYALGTTINNVISNLRKYLTCSAKLPKYIKTIQNKGYEFIVDVSVASQDNSVQINDSPPLQAAANATQPSTPKFFIQTKVKTFTIGIFVLVLLVAYLASYIASMPESHSTHQNITGKLLPITSEQGQEWSPNLSVDGRFLAYVHRNANDEPWQIKIKELATAKETILTEDFANKFSPTWSHSGDKVFFIKTFSSSCEIWFADVSNGFTETSLQHVVTCGVHSNMSPIAIGPYEEWLYYSEVNDNRIFVIKRINLLSKQIEQLTSPPTNGVGDYTLALSPNGRYIAYLRSTMGIKTKLMIMDIASSEHVALAEFNHRMYRISWDNDNSQIYFMDAKNNLSSIEHKSRQVHTRAILQNKSLSPYISTTNQYFIVDGDFYLNDIISINMIPTTSSEKVEEKSEVSSSYHDENPVHNNEQNKLAFVSARTGIKQIWLTADNKYIQLSHFKDNSFISNLQFSPDDYNLLFFSDQIPYVINLKNLETTPLLTAFKNTATAVWSCDGNSILMTSLENGTWNLYRYMLANKSVHKLKGNINVIKSDCAKSSLYVAVPKQGIYLYNELENTLQRKITEHKPITANNWLVKNNNLYLLSDSDFIRTNLLSKKVTSLIPPKELVQSFDIINNRLFYSKKHFTNTSIKQLVND